MRATALLLSLFVALTPALHADDGAASIAAGGIVLMKREPRIAMAKEVLNISEHQVAVDYEFRNDSDADITTEVAFPIPPYGFCCGERDPTKQGFDDFKLWIEGQPRNFSVEVRAVVDGHDVTDELRAMSIDIATFGHYSEKFESSTDLVRLTASQMSNLEAEKAISVRREGQEVTPLWDVQKKYHWQQTFPARGIVHIRHVYTPWLGSSNSVQSDWLHTGKDAEDAGELPTVCPGPDLLRTLRRDLAAIAYVDFILTTANTWKQPIEDFTLNVQRDSSANFVSFCWTGSVTKTSKRSFTAHKTNFVPSSELRIGFLTLYKPG